MGPPNAFPRFVRNKLSGTDVLQAFGGWGVAHILHESFVYTACPGWGDHDYCVIKTIVKDGKIVRTEKAEYPNKFLGCSHICQKGLESCKQPYNENRLLPCCSTTAPSRAETASTRTT